MPININIYIKQYSLNSIQYAAKSGYLLFDKTEVDVCVFLQHQFFCAHICRIQVSIDKPIDNILASSINIDKEDVTPSTKLQKKFAQDFRMNFSLHQRQHIDELVISHMCI